MAYVPYTSAARDFVTDKPERKRAGFFRRLANAIGLFSGYSAEN